MERSHPRMCCQYFKITAPRSTTLSREGAHAAGAAVLQRSAGWVEECLLFPCFSPFKQRFHKHYQGGKWLLLADRFLLVKLAGSMYSLLLKARVRMLDCCVQCSAGTTQRSAGALCRKCVILPLQFSFPSPVTCSSRVKRCILKAT